MIRKQFVTLHEEALDRLCFVCGEIITQEKFYEVEEYIELLSKGLKCELFTMPGVTPSHFCRKCHSAVTSVATGLSIQSARKLLDWEECNAACPTCEKLMKRKKFPGRKKKASILFNLVCGSGPFSC